MSPALEADMLPRGHRGGGGAETTAVCAEQTGVCFQSSPSWWSRNNRCLCRANRGLFPEQPLVVEQEQPLFVQSKQGSVSRAAPRNGAGTTADCAEDTGFCFQSTSSFSLWEGVCFETTDLGSHPAFPLHTRQFKTGSLVPTRPHVMG